MRCWSPRATCANSWTRWRAADLLTAKPIVLGGVPRERFVYVNAANGTFVVVNFSSHFYGGLSPTQDAGSLLTGGDSPSTFSASAIANSNAQELNAIHTSEIRQNNARMPRPISSPTNNRRAPESPG